jgi:hypothetical protein
MQIPIFPLNVVLFPNGPLPLRIFETRYIDMVSECMKLDRPFGVLLVQDDFNISKASVYKVGTLAKINDFHQGSDGLLGVTARGGQRFRMMSCEREAKGLNIAKIELIEEEKSFALPPDLKFLSGILENILKELGLLYEGQDKHYDDAVWVSHRFFEVLPIDLAEKQASLESSCTTERLNQIVKLLESFRKPGNQ